MSELIMSRSFNSLARWVRTRIPSEQTFSVVVRSAAAVPRRWKSATEPSAESASQVFQTAQAFLK